MVLAKLPKLLATVNMFPVFRLAFNILQLQYHVKLPCSLQALISMLLPANEAHKQVGQSVWCCLGADVTSCACPQ